MSRLPRIVFVALCWCLALTSPVQGADPGYTPGRTAFRSYGVEKGLGNLSVLTLLQDRAGYLWAGTEDGLYRYDGRDFQRFDRRQGLPSTYVGALHESAAGVLWAGTYAGLAQRDSNGFRVVAPEAGLPTEQVETLASTPDGRLWVGFKSGLFVQSLDSKGFVPAPGWPGGEATALAVEPGGRIWATVLSGGPGGLARVLSLEGNTWRTWSLPGLDKERVDALARDGAGRIWVRTAKGMWALEPGTGQVFHSVAEPSSLASTPGHLCVDRKGRVMVPTGTGLFTWVGSSWQRLGPQEGLPVDWARIALEDREGSLWIGSTGLHRQLGGGVWRGYGVRDGLPSDVARALFQDRQGRILVGTEKGVAQASSKGFQVLPGTAANAIRSIQEGPDGVLYMAGLPIEVVRIDPRTGRVEHFGPQAGLVRGKRIFRLVLDPGGTLWVALDGGGLMAAQTGKGPLRFSSVALPGGDENEYISGLAMDGQGRIWACGEKGLALLEKGTWKRFTRNDGLKQTHVAYLLPLRNGEFVAAYFEATGLSRLNYEGGRLQVSDLNVSSVLEAQKVYMLGEDRRGRLWIGTGQGVFLLDGARERQFGAEDGLVGDDINNMTFLEDREGNIWIGTLAGLARFDSRVESPAPPAPRTVILGSTLGRRSWDGLPPDELQLSHRENLLEVRFAGLSFLREAAVQSETRLVGLEPEWRTTRTRELHIPALPPGSYRFEVRSRIGEGPWGEVAGFAFTVRPAWWQTWWFRSLAGLGLLGLGTLAFWWRLRNLHQRTALLESIVADRTQELQQANEALRMQSLTDPLTGLRNRRFLGVCMPDDVAQVNRTHRNISLGKVDRHAMNIDMVFLMVDVDHFKVINDEYGHHAGDQVLQQLAEILRAATRDSDTVVRWGGEEFLVVARSACRKDFAVLAERIRSQVESHVFHLETGEEVRRTCSVGFAFYPLVGVPPDHVSWEQAVDVADHALYAAKRGGRNAWVGIFSRLGLEAREIPQSPAHEIRNLLASGCLEVVTSLPDSALLDWDPPKS